MSAGFGWWKALARGGLVRDLSARPRSASFFSVGECWGRSSPSESPTCLTTPPMAGRSLMLSRRHRFLREKPPSLSPPLPFSRTSNQANAVFLLGPKGMQRDGGLRSATWRVRAGGRDAGDPIAPPEEKMPQDRTRIRTLAAHFHPLMGGPSGPPMRSSCPELEVPPNSGHERGLQLEVGVVATTLNAGCVRVARPWMAVGAASCATATSGLCSISGFPGAH